MDRLRATVPAKLWRWSVVTGWKWTLGREHINSVELHAILTALRWRAEHKHHLNTRVIHMTDSLVCLHSLTRGRSSSRKLRRTMSRIHALILASNLRQHSPKIGRRPSKYPAFYSDFLLFPFFGSFGSTWVNIGLKIGPHSFQDRPT